MLLKFAPFYRFLLAIAFSELRQLGTKAVVDLSMDVPQLPLGLVLSSGFEIEENVILAGGAISVLVSNGFQFWLNNRIHREQVFDTSIRRVLQGQLLEDIFMGLLFRTDPASAKFRFPIAQYCATHSCAACNAALMIDGC
jgi:hypothetical protein